MPRIQISKGAYEKVTELAENQTPTAWLEQKIETAYHADPGFDAMLDVLDVLQKQGFCDAADMIFVLERTLRSLKKGIGLPEPTPSKGKGTP